MKLQELSAPKPSKQIAKVFESYFGKRIRLEQLTERQARIMLGKVRGVLREHRTSTSRHYSEKNPHYLQLMVMEQALSHLVRENMPAPVDPAQANKPGSTGATTSTGSTAAPVSPTAAVAGGKPAVAGAVAKDPKLQAALKKSAAGQSLNSAEQKLVAGAAMMQAENRLRNAFKVLKESEVQQAQVVLAAQDMVDKMQGMLEDTSELQFKELPALVDSIKNNIGMEQATQFNSDATAAFTGLMQNLQAAKQQLDTALGVVTGQAPAAMPGADMAAPGAEAPAPAPMPGEEPAMAEPEMPAEPEAELEPGAEPTAGALGRAKR